MRFWIFFLGYGHITPATNTGRAITIVYAIIGIPLFLILLADFGKLFTRGIKFVWAYVRRLYYTGSLRRVRKQAQVQVNQYYPTHYRFLAIIWLISIKLTIKFLCVCVFVLTGND